MCRSRKSRNPTHALSPLGRCSRSWNNSPTRKTAEGRAGCLRYDPLIAPISIHDEDLIDAGCAATHEGDLAAVRRPRGVDVVCSVVGQPPSTGAVFVDDID